MDWYFEGLGIQYFRYSDDILIFADTYEELMELQKCLYEKIKERHLLLNSNKVKISSPGEDWEFLGFCYHQGKIDLSKATIQKMKGKIKRKANALRRWQKRKAFLEKKLRKDSFVL